jgi:hypothetical protein
VGVVPVAIEETLARTVLTRYLGVRRGEIVTVETWSHALPWARAFLPEARHLGAHPVLVVEDEEAFFRSLTLVRRGPLPHAIDALADVSDAYVYLGGPEAFPRLFGFPPGDVADVVRRHGEGWKARAGRKRLRAVRLAISDVTPTAATRYGVNLAVWRGEILRGSLVPPERLGNDLARWLARGSRGRRLRIRHPNGTDLTVGLWPGRWRAEVGDARTEAPWRRIPSGVLLVPIAPGTAEGTWEANRPTYDRLQEPSVTVGAKLRFRAGRLQSFEFDRGGEAFAAAYAAGGRGRDVPGALTIGLNPSIDLAPEVGELAAGAVGLLVGDNRRAGGRSSSRFSYLTTLANADLELDGRPWAAGGRLVRSEAVARRARSAPVARSRTREPR